jgi:DMSO/TMAO reductase YedYZ molybdopterin-dependent catalytic subunit
LLSADRFAVADARRDLTLPAPAEPARPVPPGTDLDVGGLTPWRTDSAKFYQVDTAIFPPQVKPSDWSLRIHGRVGRELRLSFAELLDRPLIERDITLTCVSNEVGGNLAGNARWLGVRLADLLSEAGVRPDADQILSRSADGWTCSTPTAVVMDGRDAMLAVAMNGEPLPVRHGFPVRMVVPGLYGYVSATKWVVDLELTTFDDEQAYWTTRGWGAKGPIKVASRIDVPDDTSTIRAGRTAVAGVAWSQHTGIRGVEVRVDDGPWRPAKLAAVPSADTWRQWVYDWDAKPGDHKIAVRATDEAGTVQTDRRADPYPDGATGWHTVDIRVK